MNDYRSEDGSSLLEILVAVAILGVAIVGLLGALGTAVLHSRLQDQQARIESELRSFADAILTAEYVPCADDATDYLDKITYTPPDGLVAPIASVTPLDPGTLVPLATCLLPGSDKGLQRFTIEVGTSDGLVSDTVELWKRAS